MFDSMVQVAGYGQDGKVYVINSSGEEIPPFSLIKIRGAVEPFTGTKPDADNMAPSLLVTNGPGKVGAGDTFRAALCSSGQIQVDMNGENPGSEANVGSTEDQWYATEDNIGFKVLGASGGYALLGPFSGGDVILPKIFVNVGQGTDIVPWKLFGPGDDGEVDLELPELEINLPETDGDFVIQSGTYETDYESFPEIDLSDINDASSLVAVRYNSKRFSYYNFMVAGLTASNASVNAYVTMQSSSGLFEFSINLYNIVAITAGTSGIAGAGRVFGFVTEAE